MERFQIVRLVLMVFAMGFICSACSTPIGNTKMPEPTQGFEPKKEYKASFDAVWKGIHNALDSNRINVATENKREGRMSTDYITGQSHMYAYGLLGVTSSRYKYQLRVTPEDRGVTLVGVTCVLEATGSKMSAWRDVSNENQQVVANLEKWLYQEIEKEVTKMTSVVLPDPGPSSNQSTTKAAPPVSTKSSTTKKKSTQSTQTH